MDPNQVWSPLHFDDGEVRFVATADFINTEFDATIDPTLLQDNPAAHAYTNLHGLCANETWLTTHTFRVAVKQHRQIAIVDNLTCSIQGKGDLVLFGLGEPIQDTNHVGWQFDGLFSDTTQQVYFHNLSFAGIPTSILTNSGLAIVTNCYFDAFFNIFASGGSAYVYNSTFANQQSMTNGGTGYFYECNLDAGVAIGLSSTLYVSGGTIGRGGSATISLTSSAHAWIQASIQANVVISSTQPCRVVNTGGPGGTVSVTGTAANVSVEGDFSAVTFSGATTAGIRRFVGTSRTIDFTGPGQVMTQNTSGSSGDRVNLRGSGVHAFISAMAAATVAGLSLTDSEVVVSFGTASAFSLDASSARCLVLLGGSQLSGSVVTNAGTGNRIITENSDTFVSAGFLTTALTNGHLLVGNGSNIATDVAMSGDVTITNVGVTAIGANKVTTSTINANAVTLAKLATQADQTVLGNVSGGAAVPVALTVTQIKTMLALAVADISGAAPLASPTFTGDPKAPTATVGDNDTSIATTAFVTTAVAAIASVTSIDGLLAMGYYS